MYDFANSGYTTVVLTAVFSAYFVGAVAGGAPWATLAWTSALSLSYLIVMLTTPVMGAWADARAGKKRLLAAVTLLCVLATAGLSWVQPGDVALAVALIIASNVAYSWGETTSYAFLPELARPEAMGRVSGWGWGLGYAGGMLTLGLCLAWVLSAQARGEPASSFVPVTMGITAAMYGAAALLTFAWLKERAQPDAKALQRGGLRASWQRLRQTWAHARAFNDFMWLQLCTVAYQGGVAVAVALSAVYAEQVIGFETQETMFLIFALNAAAMLGALAFGYWQDRVGHKFALGVTLLGWTLTCWLAASSQTKGEFWVAAAVAGVCMGTSQSAGRAMAGLLAPPQRLAEFYGLWSVAARLASIIGPMLYGLVNWATGGDHRLSIMSTMTLFVLAILALLPLNMARGRAAALRDGEASVA
jgi:UMF1 family MFS transporter